MIKKKILIVEDDYATREFFNEIFSEYDLDINFAATGKEALDKLKDKNSYNIVLLDIQLPDIHGLEVLKQIRQLSDDIVVIAETAFAMKGDREALMKNGCNDYISKPFDQTKVFDIVNKYL
jgi:CheY-like chemotaxis protein